MGLFSIFKVPVNETLKTICGAYINTYTQTNDSSKGFISMAEECVRQMRKHNRPQFSSASETFKFLSCEVSQLSTIHSDNLPALRSYLFNLMMYIRPDYYKPADFNKNERLKVLIDMNLNID